MIGDSSGYPKDSIVTTTMDPLTGDVVTTTIDDESSVNIGSLTANGSWALGPYTNNTMYNSALTKNEMKKVILTKFSELSSQQRERLINRCEDAKAIRTIIPVNPYALYVTCPEEELLSHVAIEDLRSIHAQLLIEEEIK